MVKKNVILCDTCNERLSTRKCDFCDADLCNSCGAKLDIVIRDVVNLEEINLCRNCSKKLGDKIKNSETYKNQQFCSKIKEDIVSYIKKEIMAQELENGK